MLVACAASVSVVLGVIILLTEHNFEAVWREELIRPLWVLPLFVCALCGLLYALRARSGMFAVPMFLLLFFAFRETYSRVVLQAVGAAVFPWVEQFPNLIFTFYFVPHLTALLLLGVFFVWVRLFRHVEPRNLTLLLFVFVTVTVSFDTKQIFIILREDVGKEDHRIAPVELIHQLESAPPPEELPDIFLVVPDRYPSNRSLKDFFDYDNTPFLTELGERGFKIPNTDTRSNYGQTYISMASSLNLSLHGDEIAFSKTIPILRNNLLVQTLKRLDYQYVHLAGWWSGTRRVPMADYVYNGTHAVQSVLTDFEETLAGMVPLRGLYLTFMEWWIGNAGRDEYECHRLKRQLAHVRTLERDERPLFVLLHAYIPHSPVTMDRMGECIEKIYIESLLWLPENLELSDFQRAVAQLEAQRFKPYRKAAVDYMLHLNDELLEIFETQRAKSHARGRKFMFVIQADEGPYPLPLLLRMKDKKLKHDLTTLPAPFFREKFGIVNAIYAEGVASEKLCAIRSPVNTWRVLLGEILGLAIPLLPDNSFSPPHHPARRSMKLLPINTQLGPQHFTPGPGCEARGETQ